MRGAFIVTIAGRCKPLGGEAEAGGPDRDRKYVSKVAAAISSPLKMVARPTSTVRRDRFLGSLGTDSAGAEIRVISKGSRLEGLLTFDWTRKRVCRITPRCSDLRPASGPSGPARPQHDHALGNGAGREHSRSAARKKFTRPQLDAAMQGIEWRQTDAFLDEIPAAYKDIDVVMADAADLVEIRYTLRQIINVKGD